MTVRAHDFTSARNFTSSRRWLESLFLARRHTMLDVVYIALTVGFFALMLAYIRVCEALGHEDTNKEGRP